MKARVPVLVATIQGKSNRISLTLVEVASQTLNLLEWGESNHISLVPACSVVLYLALNLLGQKGSNRIGLFPPNSDVLALILSSSEQEESNCISLTLVVLVKLACYISPLN